jgi:hypothetical protein
LTGILNPLLKVTLFNRRINHSTTPATTSDLENTPKFGHWWHNQNAAEISVAWRRWFMSKGTMIAFLAGAVAVIVGIVLLVVWWDDFLVVLKGALGPMLALGGLLVIAIAWSEYQAAKEMERLTAQTQQPSQPTQTSSEQTQQQ